MLLAIEFAALEPVLDHGEPLAQILEARHDEPDMAAQHVRVALRQMELALADIDPHVVGAGKHVRVAGQAEPREIEIGSGLLVRDPEIDVFEADDVADILGLAVILLLGLCHLALQSC